MLVLRKDSEGVWVQFRIRGEKIELKIRPLSVETSTAIRKKHKKIDYVKDPQTKQMVKTEIINDDAILEDMIDHVLEDFKGIGIAPGEPLPVTRENKKRVVFIPQAPGDQPILDFILEQANELAVLQKNEIEAEIKNS